MKLNPANDGIDHINVYSKGKTKLGRFLSNFAYSPIETEDGPFQSIEGYWYWLSCRDDRLRQLSGYSAKAYGRIAGGKDWVDEAEFKRKIMSAIEIKLEKNPDYLAMLEACALPLRHYYLYADKVVEPKDGKWIIHFLGTYQNEI